MSLFHKIPRGLPRGVIILRSGNGFALASIGILVVVANLLLWHSGPGINWGLYVISIIGLVILNRRKLQWDRTLVVTLTLLLISALQTLRFLSMANFLVMHALIFAFIGHTGYHQLQPLWTRWMQGALSGLNSIGMVSTSSALRSIHVDEDGNPMNSKGWTRMIRIIAPAVVIVPIFAILLFAGNAVLGSWVQESCDWIGAWISAHKFPSVAQVMFSASVAYTALFLFRPGASLQSLQQVAKPWAILGTRDAKMRCFQWIMLLVALNALFALSTMTDVIFLWFSKTLPEGVNHSRYVHQGVYVLVFTTMLSAGLMALITQHAGVVRDHLWVKGLSFLWILQNLVLISGVFLRLWMYIDAHGYTPKRVYVAFVLLCWALLKRKGIQWLVGRNLLAVFYYFFILQLWNVNGTIADRNIALYRAGEIGVPESRLISEMGSEGIRYLNEIADTQDAKAFEQIQTRFNGVCYTFKRQFDYDWRAYQLRRVSNSRHFRALQFKIDRMRNSLQPLLENGSDTDTPSDT